MCPASDHRERDLSIRSKHLGQTTTAHFRNKSGQNVQLFYVSDKGENILVAELAVEERVSIDTVEGHVFAALDKLSGQILLLHTVGFYVFGDFSESENVGVQCEDADFQPLERQYDGPPLECGFISKGFINLSKCKINVFYFNGSGEELLMQLLPWQTGIHQQQQVVGPTHFAETFHYEGIYLTHQFIARLPSGKLLQEKKVGHIDIPSCASNVRGDNSMNSLKAPLSSSSSPVFKNVTGQFTFSAIDRNNNSSSCISELRGVDSKTHKELEHSKTTTWKRGGCNSSSNNNNNNNSSSDNMGILFPRHYIPPIHLNMSKYLLVSMYGLSRSDGEDGDII